MLFVPLLIGIVGVRMGLFRFLFGRKVGVTEATATGALMGAAIGNEIDKRAQLSDIAQLIRVQIEQNALASADRRSDFVDLIGYFESQKPDQYAGWKWMWLTPPASMDLRAFYCWHVCTDKGFSKLDKDLYERYRVLVARGVQVGIVVMARMPRDASGDVAGTPKMLTVTMDRVEKEIVQRERFTRLHAKYGL